MGRPVVHWELMSKDPAKVSDFYARIFDWKVQHRPEMNYRIVDNGGAVDDLAAYRNKIVAAGGTICIEEQQVPGMGAFSLFTEPEGRMMGLWKAAT